MAHNGYVSAPRSILSGIQQRRVDAVPSVIVFDGEPENVRDPMRVKKHVFLRVDETDRIQGPLLRKDTSYVFVDSFKTSFDGVRIAL